MSPETEATVERSLMDLFGQGSSPQAKSVTRTAATQSMDDMAQLMNASDKQATADMSGSFATNERVLHVGNAKSEIDKLPPEFTKSAMRQIAIMDLLPRISPLSRGMEELHHVHLSGRFTNSSDSSERGSEKLSPAESLMRQLNAQLAIAALNGVNLSKASLTFNYVNPQTDRLDAVVIQTEQVELAAHLIHNLTQGLRLTKRRTSKKL